MNYQSSIKYNLYNTLDKIYNDGDTLYSIEYYDERMEITREEKNVKIILITNDRVVLEDNKPFEERIHFNDGYHEVLIHNIINII